VWYENNSLICSDCKKTSLQQYLEAQDFPATFTEIFKDPETGFSVTKINNHVDKETFFRCFDRHAACLGEFTDILQAMSIGAPRLIRLK
jgi:RNA binding exosome subunit